MVLDAPQIVAQRVEEVLSARQGLATSEATSHRFEVTDWTQSFADGATHIMGDRIELHETPWPKVL